VVGEGGRAEEVATPPNVSSIAMAGLVPIFLLGSTTATLVTCLKFLVLVSKKKVLKSKLTETENYT
jgi:hypothetical protein